MGNVPLYERFEEYCGKERARKFFDQLLSGCKHRGRLNHWMDELWSEFAAHFPDTPTKFEEIQEALLICPLHHLPLITGTAMIVYGLVRHTNEYMVKLETEFLFARRNILGGCSIDEDSPAAAKVNYCEACRQAYDEWVAEIEKRTKRELF